MFAQASFFALCRKAQQYWKFEASEGTPKAIEGKSMEEDTFQKIKKAAAASKRQEHKNSLHGKKPFFFYVAFNAIHGPLEKIPRYTDKYDKRYAALKCLDDAVGRIVGAIDQYGYKEDTLVIFANDNGGLRDEMNAPYRGHKNTNYEGGVRVPCVFRWPRNLEAGSANNGMMHIVDLGSRPTVIVRIMGTGGVAGIDAVAFHILIDQ